MAEEQCGAQGKVPQRVCYDPACNSVVGNEEPSSEEDRRHAANLHAHQLRVRSREDRALLNDHQEQRSSQVSLSGSVGWNRAVRSHLAERDGRERRRKAQVLAPVVAIDVAHKLVHTCGIPTARQFQGFGKAGSRGGQARQAKERGPTASRAAEPHKLPGASPLLVYSENAHTRAHVHNEAWVHRRWPFGRDLCRLCAHREEFIFGAVLSEEVQPAHQGLHFLQGQHLDVEHLPHFVGKAMRTAT
mmetsp:Transcript_44576/g.103041  ORF Transcript_44576/g.103041 Transcript_44576/m.103041 type:complete len:245 (+) Transcript_44576:187-921(+)